MEHSRTIRRRINGPSSIAYWWLDCIEGLYMCQRVALQLASYNVFVMGDAARLDLAEADGRVLLNAREGLLADHRFQRRKLVGSESQEFESRLTPPHCSQLNSTNNTSSPRIAMV